MDPPFHTYQGMDNILPSGASFQETCALIDEKIASFQETYADEKIASYSKAIIALSRYRNQCASISQLPAELLCEIFDLAKMEENSMVCVKFSHVCHRWRTLALESAILWNKIPLHRRLWVKEMLERSKRSNLILETVDDDFNIKAWEMLINQTSRVKTINLKMSPGNWVELRDSPPMTVPGLESLSLTLQWPRNFKNLQRPLAPLISDDVINGTDMLRRLELRGKLQINWSSRLLHSPLTHLILECNVRLTISQFLDVFLHLAPTLQCLVMGYRLRLEIGSLAPIPQQMVHLRCLQSLTVSLFLEDIISLFQCVTFPANSTISIRSLALAPDHDSVMLKNIFSAVAQSYLRPGSTTAFRRFVASHKDFEYGYTLVMQLIGMTKKTLPDNSTLLDEDSVTFQFDTEDSGESSSNSEDDGEFSSTNPISSLFESRFPLHSIEGIDVSALNFEGDSSILAQSMGTLPNLESLVIGETCLKYITEILRRPSLALFPSLKSLSIKYACLLSTTSHNALKDTTGRQLPPESMDLLNDCLAHRYNNNAGIEELYLTGCEIGNNCPDILTQMKRFIRTVDWDSCQIVTG